MRRAWFFDLFGLFYYILMAGLSNKGFKIFKGKLEKCHERTRGFESG
ncbi:hypothetical protein N752_30530 [Desulforamulus aquiferis]|nr:hypothetical protein N752_30530 [Desulforamulus aquiferis]